MLAGSGLGVPIPVFVFVLLLFVVVVLLVAEHEGIAVHFLQDGSLEHLHRLAFGPFALARFLVVFPGLEDQPQPGSHLIDRGQLTGRTGFAAWTGRALHARLALWPRFAALALRSGFARCPLLAASTVMALSSRI